MLTQQRSGLAIALGVALWIAPDLADAQTPGPAATPDAPTTAPALSPWAAGTAPPPPPPSAVVVDPQESSIAALARLRSVLTWHTELDRNRRRTVSIVGGIAGGVTLATGIALQFRDREIDQFVGVLTSAFGAGALLGVAIGSLISGPFESVHETMRDVTRRRLPADEALRVTEGAWRERAERAGRGRRVGSTALIVVGGVTMIIGGTLLFVDPDRSSSRNTYRFFGMSAMGVGMMSAVAGASLLFAPDPLEQSWEVYQRTAPQLSVGAAPVPGGAMATVGGSF